MRNSQRSIVSLLARSFALTALTALSSPLLAQASFIELGSPPGAPADGSYVAVDLSSDGRVVTGYLEPALDRVGFRWTEVNGMEVLGWLPGAPGVRPTAISADGARICGVWYPSGRLTPTAWTWSSTAPAQTFAPIGLGYVQAYPAVAIGNAASYVIGSGIGTGGGQERSIKWTPAAGGVPLDITNYFATDASVDGSVVAGTQYDFNFEFTWPVVWREGLPPINVPAGGPFDTGFLSRVSADGNVVAGYSVDAAGVQFRPFVWSAATGTIGTGPGGALAGGAFGEAVPQGISGDGSTVLFGDDGQSIWMPPAPPMVTRDYLVAQGVPVPAGSLRVLRVSDDGNAFCGSIQSGGNERAFVAYLTPPQPTEISQPACSQTMPNSTGLTGSLRGTGSIVAEDGFVRLAASNLPRGSFGFFLNARAEGVVPGAGGSAGTLCLGGSVGRYDQSIGQVGLDGVLGLDLDLGDTPTPTGAVGIVAGETWYFQGWHRDVPSAGSSNLTDSIRVSFD